jgi:hypothetical protein
MAYTDVAEPDHYQCKPVAKRACLNCKNDFSDLFWHLTSHNTPPLLGQKTSPPQPSS